MTMTGSEIQDIIKIQLRKPKSWSWQLSTSKSSPEVALPIIHLYDAKGRLLLEARHGIGTERKTWHSSNILQTNVPSTNAETGFTKSAAGQLLRCRSDTSYHSPRRHSVRNKYESISRKDIKDAESIALLGDSITGKDPDVPENENRKSLNGMGNSINGESAEPGKSHRMHGSESSSLRSKDSVRSHRSSESSKRRSLQNNPHEAEVNEPITPLRHRRSRSDDLFRRKLIYNESIKRAEIDGYRNFITPRESSPKPQKNKTHMTEGGVLLGNNASNIEVNHCKHNRYKTRTCSAGTLIFREESFSNPRVRHRKRRDSGVGSNASFGKPNTTEQLDGLNPKDTRRDVSGETKESARGTSFPVRQASDPTAMKLEHRCRNKHAHNRYEGNRENIHQRTGLHSKDSNKSSNAGLFHSLSEVFPFEHLIKDKIDTCVDNNSNNIVQKPITSSESRKSSAPSIESTEKKKRTNKPRRRYKDESMPAATTEMIDRRKRKENDTKGGHLVNNHSTSSRKARSRNGGGSCDDDSGANLLQLVRRLSSSDHVKMGANVSRHSAKGLSGRRSQSSGSICNGKGRHSDGKICSSLPSYLDDRDSNGCNNNHDCEKPPLDEVERIPPLGDGAPLHWKFSDNQTVLCDQGYGSERSPEEEYPPPLPDHDLQCHHLLEPHACYPFITPDSTFTVKLSKGSRGLGLSVTGGIDSGGSWPGLIRIKRLFPHQPASACGLLNVGDLLLEANGITLIGLTNYEALEVLRTSPNQVDLKVCRPPPDVLSCVSPISEVPPPPPKREPPTSLNLPTACYSTPEDEYYHGEFEVMLTKIQGSLGFTLRKEDDSALGHYVRALVREPALTDGRIRAGDKIIAVNDVEISPMSHEQAVQFLRQCGDIVRLRLYRDSAQTPVAALSPSETTPRNSFSRKANLRQEAVDMLNDIAVRKLIPGNQDTYRRSLSPTASPRRLRRHPCPSDASHITDSSTKYMLTDEQFHEGLLQKCSHPFDDEAFNSLFSTESDDGDKPSRPSSLDLYNPNQTPVAARKPRFNFSLAHNAYELNNLDPEILDAPNLTYNLGNDDVKSTEVECGDSFPQEPASMPHIPLDNPGFSYKNPAYQTAHPQCGIECGEEKTGTLPKSKPDDTNMKKWKGVVFDANEDDTTDGCKMNLEEQPEILAIELNRGWNSRLGFSLQGAAGVTYVSAVHADSVAAKDGRLKPGDRVLKVNDESVEHMSTSEIIDLLRIVRGPVCIVISRIKSNEDCLKSNAAN